MVPAVTTVDNADSRTFDAVLLLYIACAKLPDGALDEREAERILSLARAHTSGLADGYAERSVEDVAAALAAATDPAAQLTTVVKAAEDLAVTLDAPSKAALVDELRSIVRADGEKDPAEVDFVDAVAKTLGV